jgi:hypothetical protein
MSDAILKARILFDMLSDAYVGWRRTIRDADLDQYYCCNGRECCCGGATHRDLWQPLPAPPTEVSDE